MRQWNRVTFRVGCALAVAAVLALSWQYARPVFGQAQSGVTQRNRPAYRAPRTPDGKPDLNGIWQAVSAAHWDLLDHAAKAGPVVQMGAIGAIQGGLGIVEGGEIPYQPWAAKKQKENAAEWLKLDPVVKCYMPGIPRATYMPYPVPDRPDALPRALRLRVRQREPHGVHGRQGRKSRRYVDGLVERTMGRRDARHQRELLQRSDLVRHAGNFHSEALKVEERYTALGPDHLMYEATMDDPKVFTRPWKLRVPLYRRVEANAQLLEFKCVEFVEELMYGHLRKK